MGSAAAVGSTPILNVSLIPGFMKKKGWLVGASLMDQWLTRPPNDVPSKGVPDTSTVTMQWVLRFSRAKAEYDRLLREHPWANIKAQAVLGQKLRTKGLLIPKETVFGFLGKPGPTLDADYIQHGVVGGLLDPLDDMYAALGKSVFRIAVQGTAFPLKGGRHQITIQSVGIYLWDSYDFNGEQELGFWDFKTGDVGRTPASGTLVTNADFRAWRTANGRGGDYYVYSDVKITTLSKPDMFSV
jgi:hypothetical protein